MASLAQVTRETRIIGKFGAIALVTILFLFFSFKAIVFVNGILNPPQVAPPDMKFGELRPTLPIQASKPTFAYQINTVTGVLPTFPDRIRVYKTAKPEPDLLALQKIRDIVNEDGDNRGILTSVGYDLDTERIVSSGEYYWTNAAGGSLTYNILYKNFEFTSGISLEAQDYLFGTEKNIVSETLSFINAMGSSTTGIDQENFDIEYFRSDGITQIPDSDISTAYLAKLNLYQIPVKVDPFLLQTTATEQERVESLPIFYEDPEESNQTFMIKAGLRQLQFVSGIYAHFPLDTTEYGIYPLKSSQQAYEDLQNGNGYILSASTENTVSISEVSLGYFIPKSQVEYIMPIYIFKGRDFTAYVHAIGEIVPETN